MPVSPVASVIHARVKVWTPVVETGSTVEDQFEAGRALVKIYIRPDGNGNVRDGMTRLEHKLVRAAEAAQSPGTKVSVEILPSENLGFHSFAEVTGPA